MKKFKNLITFLLITVIGVTVLIGCANLASETEGKPSKYTVSFSQNRPLTVTSSVTNMPVSIKDIPRGNTIIEPTSKPKLAGFYFDGWHKETSCINKWDFATDTVTRNLTLFAKWTDENAKDEEPQNEDLPKNSSEWKSILGSTKAQLFGTNPNYKLTQVVTVSSTIIGSTDFIVDGTVAYNLTNYYSVVQDNQTMIYTPVEIEGVTTYYKGFLDFYSHTYKATNSTELGLLRAFSSGQDQVNEVFPYLLLFLLTENNFEWLEIKNNKIYLKDGHLADIFQSKLDNFNDIKTPNSNCATGAYYCTVTDGKIASFGFDKYAPNASYEYTFTYGGQTLSLPQDNIVDAPRNAPPTNLTLEQNQLSWERPNDDNDFILFIYKGEEYVNQVQLGHVSTYDLSTLNLNASTVYTLYLMTTSSSTLVSPSILSTPITYNA